MLARALLHRIDVAQQVACLIPTSADRLRSQAFVDGRTDFSLGPNIVRPLADCHRKLDNYPHRFVFHVGFCGSTLLTRLLDHPGQVLALREPDCLAHLANQTSPNVGAQARDGVNRAIDYACRSLHQPFSPAEDVLVKPSNWANKLLSRPSIVRADGRAVFMTMTRSAYLRAVVRGGTDRLAFMARAALHFTGGDGAAERLVAEALAWTDDDHSRLIALAAIAHWQQLAWFRQSSELGWAETCWVELDDLRADPVGTATRASRAFGLELDLATIKGNSARWSSRHAKSRDQSYNATVESDQDAVLERSEGRRMAAVEEWAKSELDR